MMIDALIFVFFQGLFANGIQLAMQDGYILESYKRWLKNRKGWIGKPMGLCIICSSSFISTITFWPIVLYFFGWRQIELFVWAMNIPVLAVVSFYIFKKI